MPGRKNTPAQLKVITGNPGKRPINHGPKVEIEAPSCPSWLPKEARSEWRYIAKELKRYGLVTRLDKAALSAHCVALGTLKLATTKLQELDDKGNDGYIEKTPNGLAIQGVWLQIRNKAWDQVMKSAPEFGLTPAARSKVDVKQPEQADIFDQF